MKSYVHIFYLGLKSFYTAFKLCFHVFDFVLAQHMEDCLMFDINKYACGLFKCYVTVFQLQVAIVVRKTSGENLVRKRREWILPPKPLKENKDYTKELSIAKIRSDYKDGRDIEYFLEGPGANQRPFNVFVVNRETGDVRVTQVLDREEMDTYVLKGFARYKDGTDVEKPIDLRIKVEDENDNDPVFPEMSPVGVYELSPAGTFVMQVNATDADEKDNKNSKLAYTLISQNPPHDMFRIERSGVIRVKNSSLDREVRTFPTS
uniref:Cadherin domain-containing protein n=1 Tax=Oryzias sinensis TaxID=183150 RepID=A0A8C7Y5Q6_9TELE